MKRVLVKRLTQRFTATVLAACILAVGTVPTAQAGVVGTKAVAALQSPSMGPVQARLHGLFDRDDAIQALQERGVDRDAAKARIAALSDADAAELAARIDDAPAGGVNALVVVGAVFLVLVVTDLLGMTRIFPFIRPIR